MKRKNLAAARAALIYVQSTETFNDNLSHDKFFLPFFSRNILIHCLCICGDHGIHKNEYILG